VHLSEQGHPVVGDKKYGKAHDACGVLALHARSISFTHPVNGRRMYFETGVPEFFTRLIGTIVIPAA
jgi:tRNA pseudouridine32 synthase/23S rRNA pseudouridine746 synthase/23S rRNA pseudouridine1911/1915/1917 synthase